MSAEYDVRWTVIVPVRGTANSKTRLNLSGFDSSMLAAAFGLDVVQAAASATLIRQVVVTTASPYLAAAVADRGAVGVLDDAPGHLNEVVLRTVDRVRTAQPLANIAVLVGDVAMVTPGELDQSLSMAAGHSRAFVADHAGVGTVMLTARKGYSHRPRFGSASRAAHLTAGYCELELDRNMRIRHDIDTAGDLASALKRGVGSEVSRLLAMDLREHSAAR